MKGAKIIVGVSGSIAAYKSAFLTRLLVKAGVDVKVLMTRAATDFISPLTLSTLSKNDVLTSVSSEHGWNNHVDLGLWADFYVVAPATAQTIARMANGLCDDMLSAVYLSARCPVAFAPAMDLDMWTHPATQRNIATLQKDGCRLIEPTHGELASGLTGQGRMAEPEDIVVALGSWLSAPQLLVGKQVLITAGPTYEPIDPVRFIGNHSTGKMGIALADEAARLGAQVTLLLGPTHLRPTHARVYTLHTHTADAMRDAALQYWPTSDLAILSAAVADFKPIRNSNTKIKKEPGQDTLTLQLTKTTDIAAALGQTKREHQLLVGFALETDNEIAHAQQKLRTKNFDFIVLNSMQDAGAGFGHDTNKVSLISPNHIDHLPLLSKKEVAAHILEMIVQKLNP
jgi:phosphopantothenoylcysteine decarboxylase/phosphopantothenate--cysteine ligase